MDACQCTRLPRVTGPTFGDSLSIPVPYEILSSPCQREGRQFESGLVLHLMVECRERSLGFCGYESGRARVRFAVA